ncbi:hypothetical protein ET475_00085 [Microbacterium protaetiae]|uniref:Uncharacterized protein n=1 Tax=Microbacterium protaetiae TaxID=2509458 RepID=A0A4P6EL22_9MICO|nr:hypothetical protein [Microbacterium protaetiae]QAY58558.1 hypothetical protein ET475_00085 [Microbacterium protaetiae]
MKLRSRILAAGMTFVVAAGAVVAAQSSLAPTTASWSDSVYATAEVSAAAQPEGPILGPLAPGNDDTIISDVDWNIPEMNAGFCTTLTVTTNSPEPIAWAVSVDMSKAPFAGANIGDLSAQDGRATLTADPNDAKHLIMTPVSWWYPTVTAGQSAIVSLCLVNPVNPPPADNSWFNVDIARVDGWTPTRVCKTITITGNRDLEEHPFFFGWTAEVDLSDMLSDMQQAGGTPNQVIWDPDPAGGFNLVATPGGNETGSGVASKYTLVSGPRLAIKGTQSVAVTVCVSGFAA